VACLLLAEAVLLLTLAPQRGSCQPTLSEIENRTKEYFYTDYPPGNPLVVSGRDGVCSHGLKALVTSILVGSVSPERSR
jgi:hypothetical protein